MQNDRWSKCLLALIAGGLWFLAFTQLAPATAAAESGGPAEPPGAADFVMPSPRGAVGIGDSGDASEPRAPGVAAPIAPASTKPLRWRIAYAAHSTVETAGNNECFTVVSLVNSAGTNISADVDFFNAAGGLTGSAAVLVQTGRSAKVITYKSGTYMNVVPFNGSFAATSNFLGGFAQVHADDPRLIVGAFLVCEQDLGATLSPYQPTRSIANIPAFPVGSTAEYFQAGMPADWSPAVARAE